MRTAPILHTSGLVALGFALACAAAGPASADHALEGTLSAIHSDHFADGSSTTSWRLDTGSETVPILPTTIPALTPERADVKLEAQQTEGAAAVGAVSAAGPLEAAPSPGSRSLAVILANFNGDTRQPWTPEQARQAVFTGAGSTNAFFQEESYGDIRLTGKLGNPTGDVYGWYTLSASTGGCPYATWASKAKQAAAADGFVAGDYQHVMYVFPTQSSCDWAGLAYMPGSESWINGELTVRVTGHELSHNFGLHHAGRFDCGGVAISESCTLDEYGDPFDVMGSYGDRHSHSWHLERLGVLGAQNVQTASASGTYSIRSALQETTSPTTLRIPRRRDQLGNVLDWYYLEIREPGGVFDDFGALDFAVNGVSVRLVDDPAQTTVSRLLDTHPGNGQGVWDSALPAGQTFSDGAMSIQTIAAEAGVATVQVALPSGSSSDTQAPSAPTGLQSALTSGGVRLEWGASSDNIGVALYSVYRDGLPVGSSGSTSFEDPAVPAGAHVYTLYAEDAAGNRSPASAPHVVTVPAPPAAGGTSTGTSDATNAGPGGSVAADTLAPRPSLRLRRGSRGRLLLRARAADDRAVARLELWIDGSLKRRRAAASLRYRWRARRGRHRIVVRAFDTSGNTGTLERRLRKR